jgi:hypothetical protein
MSWRHSCAVWARQPRRGREQTENDCVEKTNTDLQMELKKKQQMYRRREEDLASICKDLQSKEALLKKHGIIFTSNPKLAQILSENKENSLSQPRSLKTRKDSMGSNINSKLLHKPTNTNPSQMFKKLKFDIIKTESDTNLNRTQFLRKQRNRVSHSHRVNINTSTVQPSASSLNNMHGQPGQPMQTMTENRYLLTGKDNGQDRVESEDPRCPDAIHAINASGIDRTERSHSAPNRDSRKFCQGDIYYICNNKNNRNKRENSGGKDRLDVNASFITVSPNPSANILDAITLHKIPRVPASPSRNDSRCVDGCARRLVFNSADNSRDHRDSTLIKIIEDRDNDNIQTQIMQFKKKCPGQPPVEPVISIRPSLVLPVPCPSVEDNIDNQGMIVFGASNSYLDRIDMKNSDPRQRDKQGEEQLPTLPTKIENNGEKIEGKGRIIHIGDKKLNHRRHSTTVNLLFIRKRAQREDDSNPHILVSDVPRSHSTSSHKHIRTKHLVPPGGVIQERDPQGTLLSYSHDENVLLGSLKKATNIWHPQGKLHPIRGCNDRYLEVSSSTPGT